MIYAITMNEGRFVKIGFTGSRDLEKRAKQLQTGSPYYLKPEFMVEGSLVQEQALHGALRMAFYRIRIPLPGNEWYPAKCPFMREFVERLRDGGPNSALAWAERYSPAVKQWGKAGRFAEKDKKRRLNDAA